MAHYIAIHTKCHVLSLLYYCTVYCTIVLLHHCTIALLCCCTVVLLYYSTIVLSLLYYCIVLYWTNFICRQAHNIYAYKLHYFLFYIQYSKKKIYFKKRTRPLLHQQLTGGFAKIFFFSAEPPPSRHRTMHIALLLKNNHS